MHLILDANVYARDYRMSGVSFRTLFDYMRRTQAKLVLPHSIREEVILDYGRRLKSGSKQFAEVWNRYRHLELEDRPVFHEPDPRQAQRKLRRQFRKPMGGMSPIYISEMSGVSLEEVFMRGVHRRRPANEPGGGIARRNNLAVGS
jgi:hypothetical protein